MKVLSPAKINLFLQVTGKRADGYHELFSLMCCVSLFDTIHLQFGGKKIEIESAHPHVPSDDTNLAHKAAALFFTHLGVDAGVKISIAKAIPVAAGLGGGSSNAASVLDGLNSHFGFPFSRKRLAMMGLGLGADVPFLLYQRPALVTGIGEKLEAYAGPLPYHIILVNPGFSVSTAEVFQNLNLRLTKCKKKFTEASLKKTGYNIALHSCNDLEAVTAARYPVIKSIKEQLLEQGASVALMSGSGPSVFGLYTDQNKADSAIQALGRHSRWNAYPVEILNEKI